jgi:hypothetical protein
MKQLLQSIKKDESSSSLSSGFNVGLVGDNEGDCYGILPPIQKSLALIVKQKSIFLGLGISWPILKTCWPISSCRHKWLNKPDSNWTFQKVDPLLAKDDKQLSEQQTTFPTFQKANHLLYEILKKPISNSSIWRVLQPHESSMPRRPSPKRGIDVGVFVLWIRESLLSVMVTKNPN